MKLLLLVLLGICSLQVLSQESIVKGIVVEAGIYQPIPDLEIELEGSPFATKTDSRGEFVLEIAGLAAGEYVLLIKGDNYRSLRLPLLLKPGEIKNLDMLLLNPDLNREQMQINIISLADAELDEEEGGFENVSGLLQATRDVFLNAAAFDFGQTFFRPRGLGSEQGKVLINGIEMNKLYSGRPQWSNWGGLNDVQRNQEFSLGLTPSDVSFGGLAGTTNILMRASKYAPGGRISIAASNRSYNSRLMATWNSGENAKGWAYSISLSRRFAAEAYVDGSLYEANSAFISVEKKLNASHSLNFTAFYTPNLRGKTSPITNEVFEMKDERYNSYWGLQDGRIRNSRVRDIHEPIFMLNHYWKISEKISLNNNLAYQFGKIGNSRIDFGGTRKVDFNGESTFLGGGVNPDPTYYQKLPGYFLRFPNTANYQAAWIERNQFENNGQLDWESLYRANEIAGYTLYALSEDRNDDRQLMYSSFLDVDFSENLKLNSGLRFTYLNSHNFASIRDMLGGENFLDIDFFEEGNLAQNDLNNPNRLVGENEPYKYNFRILARRAEAFGQLQFNSKFIEAFAAANLSQSRYQREGLFRNASFPETSFGKSEALNFTDFGIKSGFTYKITGRHLVSLNAAYLTKAPDIRSSFSNIRQNNHVVRNLKSESIYTADLSYRFRAAWLNTRLTGYFTQFQDATNISFYYADGLSGLGRLNTTAFVQEVLTGIDKRHFGVEWGAESQITPAIKLKAAAALGQFTYSNNPSLYLTSNDFNEAVDLGTSYLKNYRLAGGPQTAAQVGFEYRDPNFWWFGMSLNYFDKAFINISPITRTENFSKDTDGQPLLDYDPRLARELLRQEEFKDYFLLNAIGGKSWLVKGKYLGFFISLNNILDVIYKTGGFEQSRNVNYRSLKEDRERELPLFSPRYWYGTGATYYMNFYLRF